MIEPVALREPRGRLAQTVMELVLIERSAAFRRGHRERARQRLRHSDELLRLVEECRVRNLKLVPPSLWSAVVHLVASVDAQMRDDLGINRHPDHVADILFMTQGQLMHDAQVERTATGLAPIIPLFPPVRDSDT